RLAVVGPGAVADRDQPGAAPDPPQPRAGALQPQFRLAVCAVGLDVRHALRARAAREARTGHQPGRNRAPAVRRRALPAAVQGRLGGRSPEPCRAGKEAVPDTGVVRLADAPPPTACGSTALPGMNPRFPNPAEAATAPAVTGRILAPGTVNTVSIPSANA